jgi:hypothetical protein
MTIQSLKPEPRSAFHAGPPLPLKPRTAAVFDCDYAVALVALRPGITDREMAASVYGAETLSHLVTPVCRALAAEGAISRRMRRDGVVGNYMRDD